jgi:hypothetical protein
MARAVDGLRVKVWGDAAPSTSSTGAPTPAMISLTRACMGLIVTTTVGVSAAATAPDKSAISKTAPAQTRAELNIAIEEPPITLKDHII